MAGSGAVSASAEEATTNEAVNAATGGIIEIEVRYNTTGEKGKGTLIQTGTGFLINQNTYLTCSHVIEIDDSTIEVLESEYNDDYDPDYLDINVIVRGDIIEESTVVANSEDYDYAVLTVPENTFNTRTPLVLSNCENVKQTQVVYALGYPSVVSFNQNNTDYAPFDTDDVTVSDGKISKIDYTFNDGTTMGLFIQHSATISAGNSGGPLVDENGYVIGINKGVVGEYKYALEIDQVIATLDDKGIDYDTPDDSTTTTEESTDEEVTETTTLLTTTTQAATTEAATTNANDAGTTSDSDDGDNNFILFVAIFGGAAVILIVVIIILIVKSGKKTPQPVASAPMAMPKTAPQATPIMVGGQRPTPPVQPQSYPETGAGETTLLDDGRGETSLLGGGMQSARAMLIRRKNGTNIPIKGSEFIIGKQRSRVNYCINNNAISRQHAKISNNGGIFYITDMGSSNYTYVNGEEIAPNVPKQISNGDIIKLADEEFEFRG
ncbi:MAG: trypsin-like peptidase domain-containing protein [Ruminococcus sp.]|nr:trypsin-like peptidase domain-containing protein [Ruminococcus sp.]